MAVIDATATSGLMFEMAENGVRKVIPTGVGEKFRALVQANQYDLVIVDNASDAFDGDENHRRQVRTFVRYLGSWVKPHKGAVMLLAHIDKNAARYGSGGNSYSGSTGWHNSARSRLAFIDDELRQEKLNVGRAMEAPISLVWSGAVPMPAGHGAGIAKREAEHVADDEAVLACFRIAHELGRSVPAAERGPATTWHALSSYEEFPESLKGNKDRFREAVFRLLRRGAIVREDYKNAQRKPAERLVLAPG
jgi:hypothetical protein